MSWNSVNCSSGKLRALRSHKNHSRVKYLFNFLAHRKPILNPNNIGADNAYGIDFESGVPRKELGWFAKGLKAIGADIPGLGLLINGEEYTQRATCAVMAECFGSRHLSDEMRQTALGLEPQVKAMALTTEVNQSIRPRWASKGPRFLSPYDVFYGFDCLCRIFYFADWVCR